MLFICCYLPILITLLFHFWNLCLNRSYGAEIIIYLFSVLDGVQNSIPKVWHIPTDPTGKHKNRLINILKSMKAEHGMSENTYKMMYPTGASAPKFYGLPKIQEKDIP